MAFDSARSRVVMFGGFHSPPGFGTPTVYGDTWEWNGTSWKRVSTSGPSPRYGHAVAYDSIGRQVILFSGGNFRAAIPADTWEWNGTVWTQRSITGPPQRYEHSMACDSARDRIVLFGGANGWFLGDTWEWDSSIWMQK